MQGKAGSSGQGQKGQAAEGTCFALCGKCPGWLLLAWLTFFLGQDKRLILTMEDLSKALREVSPAICFITPGFTSHASDVSASLFIII